MASKKKPSNAQRIHTELLRLVNEAAALLSVAKPIGGPLMFTNEGHVKSWACRREEFFAGMKALTEEKTK